MGKAIKVLTDWRVMILIFFIVMAIWSVSPQFDSSGVSIVSIEQNSSASIAGISPPKEGTLPLYRERIVEVDGNPIYSVEEYKKSVSNLVPGDVLHITTNKDDYSLLIKPLTETIILNETEKVNYTEEVFDEEFNETVNVTKYDIVNKTEERVIGTEDIGLNVDKVPSSNIRQGIDLIGGIRFKFKPAEELSDDQFNLLMDNMIQRLNVYGLLDISVRSAQDLPTYLGGTGEKFIIVETSSANEEAIETLKAQGKFEAKVGNNTVFSGGEDITSVCRSADCSGIQRCGPTSGGSYVCEFRFAITLSTEAAQRQADVTKYVEVEYTDGSEGYLKDQLELYLDGELVNALRISEDLKGKPVTNIAISGSDVGQTQDEAIVNTQKHMKDLQTLLITGSLPVKLIVVERTVVPPVVGNEFVSNAILIGALALLTVFIVLFLFYRKLKIVIPMVMIVFFDVIMLLGFSAFIRQTIDLAAIAGFVVAIGTGVDHLVIITDETLKGEAQVYDIKAKLKQAFGIIMVAFFTTVVAMIPLFAAGAGVLRGFATITVVGLIAGVLISRPAYANIIEILLK